MGSPGSGLEPVSPALAGGFLTTAPPGKPDGNVLYYSFSELGRFGGRPEMIGGEDWT